MAKLTIGQKAERVLKLLLGVRNQRILESLRGYGFTDADLEEGWRALKALTDTRLGQRGPVRQDPTLLVELDAWENRWFPVASASLRARFAGAHDWLFLNLSQTEGAAVVISVTTFLDRLDRMAGETGLGDAGQKARELLSQRGLGDNTVRMAKDLLAKLGTAEPAQPGTTDPEAQQKAEQAMWNWYLEWGEIARVAVTDRRLLRELGFLNAKRPVAQEDAEPSEESGGSEA